MCTHACSSRYKLRSMSGQLPEETYPGEISICPGSTWHLSSAPRFNAPPKSLAYSQVSIHVGRASGRETSLSSGYQKVKAPLRLFKRCKLAGRTRPQDAISFERARLTTFSGMVGGYAVYYFTRLSFTYVGLAMRNDLGLSMVQLGAISTIFPLAYMNSKFLSGVLSDLLGSPVLIFSIGLIMTGICNIAFAMGSTVSWFTAIWVLNGLFQGCGATPCNKMLVNWFPAQSRGKWWSSWNASHNLGGFLIPLLAGGLAAKYNWRVGMIVPGIIAVITGMVALVTMKDSPEKLGLPSAEDSPFGLGPGACESRAFYFFYTCAYSDLYLFYTEAYSDLYLFYATPEKYIQKLLLDAGMEQSYLQSTAGHVLALTFDPAAPSDQEGKLAQSVPSEAMSQVATSLGGGSSSSSAPANGGAGVGDVRIRGQSAACWECGLAAGFVVSAVLNPWDRALYLSVVNERPFFSRSNWQNPYRGLDPKSMCFKPHQPFKHEPPPMKTWPCVAQTLMQRTISTGIYFPLEDLCSRYFGSPIIGGQVAGVLVGGALNPLSLIKYQIWRDDEVRRSFFHMAKRLLKDAGPTVFARGIISTVFRDGTFGLCFSLRKYGQGQAGREKGLNEFVARDFMVSMACAALGTVISSPFNYVRNRSYAVSSEVALESACAKWNFWCEHMGFLWHGMRRQESTLAGFRWLQVRMQLGWGTARVACGMAMTDLLYHKCCEHRAFGLAK
ncbi:unnamed protein product [Polarella glacialis]|uniref:Major facilitator superfamily (MFS) profile domain-containing protein n=1 Tax=Polarella glacialis TaxID=89957 RepID=A0A813H864_POLGL|nr:unnamed protein product [Polarella glacialis]